MRRSFVRPVASARDRRLPGLVVLASLLLAALAAPSSAAAAFAPCRDFEEIDCATVTVPIDRSGGVPGSVPLRVERVRALGGPPRRGAVFALAGGPGQGATAFTEGFVELLEPVLESRDLIVFDQRGTGRSGALRCPELERLLVPVTGGSDAGALVPAVARCAETLGPRRAFYATRDSSDDIEAVRREIGVERISLFGVSYGTKVALDYAARYPEHVDRLVLDSVVEPEGPDPLARESLNAVARVVRDLCREGCETITGDAASDLSALVARLGSEPLRGLRVDPSGRARRAEISRGGLIEFLLAGDFLPEIRALLPGAVTAALGRDLMPLLRLTVAVPEPGGEPPAPEDQSDALFTATICEELDFPYSRSASPQERVAEASSRAKELGDDAFFPFDRETALESGLISLCAGWPDSGRDTAPPPPSDQITPAPTLVLSGEEDLRTPLETAQRVAARLPAGALVAVPGLGHSVLGQSFEPCPLDSVERFFVGDTASVRCPADFDLFTALPVPPPSLGAVPQARGARGPRGRTLTAVARTLDDVFVALLLNSVPEAVEGPEIDPFASPAAVRGGGLRGGRFRLSIIEGAGSRELGLRVDLDRVAYVPGVRVSGRATLGNDGHLRGRFRVSGSAAPPGRLTVSTNGRGYRLSGRLAGRRVRGSVPSDGGL